MNSVHSSADIFDCGLDLFPLLLFVFFMGRDIVKALWLSSVADCEFVQPGLWLRAAVVSCRLSG